MKFIVQVPKTSVASDTPHLIRKAENGEAYTMHQDLKEECSYDEACSLFKYYKAKTLKQNMYNSDFQYNLNMRERFLTLKKKYDMRRRAKKFRDKKKKEVTVLRCIAKQ